MRRLLLPAAALLAGAAAAVAACVGQLDHVFGGYAYDAAVDGGCLETSGAIDVVAGADPGTCPMVRCWAAPDGTIYVTDEACDAPADYVDHTQDGFPACVKALALYADPGHSLCTVPEGGAGGSAP